MNEEFFQVSAVIESDVSIGSGSRVWYFSHICEKAKIGRDCNIGEKCYVGKGVIIGNDVRVGNNVSLYEGTIIKDKVFIGNNATFTNVRKPLAYKKSKKILDTIIDEGASVGANATIVGGIKIGKRAVVADGAVITKDVPEECFVAGNPGKVKKKLNRFYEETKKD